jgi:DNA-binding transcriptional regulator YbjK
MTNDFCQLNAESAESAFAQFTTEEHAEAQAYFAQVEQDREDRAAQFALSPAYKAAWLRGE